MIGSLFVRNVDQFSFLYEDIWINHIQRIVYMEVIDLETKVMDMLSLTVDDWCLTKEFTV